MTTPDAATTPDSGAPVGAPGAGDVLDEGGALDPLEPEDAKLVTLARGARARAAAAEGAAVRDADGRTYAGATVALPSLELTALQVAVAAATSAAAAALEAAAIVGDGGAPDLASAAAARDLHCPAIITSTADGTVTGRSAP